MLSTCLDLWSRSPPAVVLPGDGDGGHPRPPIWPPQQLLLGRLPGCHHKQRHTKPPRRRCPRARCHRPALLHRHRILPGPLSPRDIYSPPMDLFLFCPEIWISDCIYASLQLVINEIDSSAPTALQAVKLLALYLSGSKVRVFSYFLLMCRSDLEIDRFDLIHFGRVSCDLVGLRLNDSRVISHLCYFWLYL